VNPIDKVRACRTIAAVGLIACFFLGDDGLAAQIWVLIAFYISMLIVVP
jgi:hypothetical protein